MRCTGSGTIAEPMGSAAEACVFDVFLSPFPKPTRNAATVRVTTAVRARAPRRAKLAGVSRAMPRAFAASVSRRISWTPDVSALCVFSPSAPTWRPVSIDRLACWLGLSAEAFHRPRRRAEDRGGPTGCDGHGAREGAGRRASPDRSQQRRGPRGDLLRAGIAQGASLQTRRRAPASLLRRPWASGARMREARRGARRVGARPSSRARAAGEGQRGAGRSLGGTRRAARDRAARSRHRRCPYSPTTAVTDYVAITHALAADVGAANGEIHLSAEGDRDPGRAGARARVETSQQSFEVDRLVICAGLQSDRISRLAGDEREPRIVPFRGSTTD